MTKLLAGRGVLAFADALERYGVEAIALPDNDAVSPVVSSHIDVSCARMPGTDDLPPAVVVPSLWSGAGIIAGYARLCGWTCVLSDALMGAAYPADVPFNVFCAAGRLFGRLKSVSPDVLAAARERGYGPVDVKQGYAACSTLVLSESALVTADRGIADAAERLGAEVLRISPGEVHARDSACVLVESGSHDNVFKRNNMTLAGTVFLSACSMAGCPPAT